MAASLAAELEKNLDGITVLVEQSPLRSEFEVLVDDEQIFSRLAQMRYPEARELIGRLRERL